MTALAQDRKTPRYGTPDHLQPMVLQLPVAASTKIYGGSMVALDASGNAVPASASPTLRVMGCAGKQVDNSAGLAAALSVPVEQGTFKFNASGSITKAHVGLLCYAVDDNTVAMTDGAGQYPPAGVVMNVDAAGLVSVMLGQPTLYDDAIDTAAGARFKARGVRTTNVADLTAFAVATGTDGLTFVAGDIVLLVAQTTASQNGPYVVGTVGSGTAPLTRPDWWFTGMTFYPGQQIEVAAGTVFAGTSWKAFKVASGVVGTDDPVFYPKAVTVSAVLVAGTVTIATIPIFSATRTGFSFVRTTANTCTLTTGGYQPTTITPGVIGTASLVVQGTVAAGTINNADISTLAVTVVNG